jgi:hypothetical protein
VRRSRSKWERRPRSATPIDRNSTQQRPSSRLKRRVRAPIPVVGGRRWPASTTSCC